MNFKSRYKDKSPQETIAKISGIIEMLGLDLHEDWLEPVEGIYSVHLRINGTNIAVNGKGSERNFALASGYGELMERLQNMLPFRINDNFIWFSHDIANSISPDEKLTDSFGETPEELKWYNQVTKNFPDAGELQEVFKSHWNDLSIRNEQGKIINLEYCSYKDPSKRMVLPLGLLNIYYGSNGMCAGNTNEEALVQGLSEILERYATYEILYKKLTPPDITNHICERYPYLHTLISRIEEGDYEVLVKDLSLGKNVPVVAVILFDKEKLKYFVSTASHPCLDIATERGITECLQGRTLELFHGMTKISDSVENIDETANAVNIFIDGEGVYPYQLFMSKPSYGANLDMYDRQYNDNLELLSSLVECIDDLGFEIYVRDENFLGVPAYHIIVPGLSELLDVTNMEVLESHKEYQRFSRNSKKINSLDHSELDELMNYITENIGESSKCLSSTWYLKLAEESVFGKITRDLLLMLYFIKTKEYTKAYSHSKEFIRFLELEGVSIDFIRHYEVISTILQLKVEGLAEEDILSVLSNFVSLEDVTSCLVDLENTDSVFEDIPVLNCPNCDDCVERCNCAFVNEKLLFTKLMKFKTSRELVG